MSDSEDDDVQSRTIKITVVGEPSCGKTSLCHRYLGSVAGGGSTQGAEVLAGQCLGLRPPVPLLLCDVGGNALATRMLDNYLYASDVVLFVYDISNLESFEKLRIWFEKVSMAYATEPKRPLMALFGNKSDLEYQRAVRLSAVRQFASEHLLETFQGSARTGETVNTAFTSLVARVVGAKVRRAPGAANGLAPRRAPPLPRSKAASNGQAPPAHQTQPLILNRKALRAIQKKASSSVCSIQ